MPGIHPGWVCLDSLKPSRTLLDNSKSLENARNILVGGISKVNCSPLPDIKCQFRLLYLGGEQFDSKTYKQQSFQKLEGNVWFGEST